MFRTQYEPHDRVLANVGTREHILYSPQLDEDGHMELVETGREDIYEQIQSHKDSCDIHTILRRFEAGDTEVLMQRQGNFGDFTTIPKTYADLLNSVIAGEQYFSQLPVETRAKFGHSFQQWMVSMDKPDFAEKMGWNPPSPAPVPDVPIDPVVKEVVTE